jgi:hypothetical protein
MTAPSCPVSSGQLPYYRSLFRGSSGGQPKAPSMPSIPAAHDLPSLISTVNIMLDALRQFTSSKTVNNLYLPRQPNFKSQGNTYYSQYPQWRETGIEGSSGFVTGKKDKTSRAYVGRQNRVHYENQTQEDPEFKWSYSIPIK